MDNTYQWAIRCWGYEWNTLIGKNNKPFIFLSSSFINVTPKMNNGRYGAATFC
jgi:hypothetical protein